MNGGPIKRQISSIRNKPQDKPGNNDYSENNAN